MKLLFRLVFGLILFQSLYSNYYVDSLDQIIYEKVVDLSHFSYEVDDLVKKIQLNIKDQVSLEDTDDFLDQKSSIAFFFYKQMQSKLNELAFKKKEENFLHIEQALNELKIALCGKIYLYYLECCKHKFFYKAVKNYDALNFWQNEKFAETQSLSQKNILRLFSRASYQDKIVKNIVLLQDISKQTNSFLGIIKHNQERLLQAKTQHEFEIRLQTAIKLQEDFLHLSDCDYPSNDIAFLITRSIDDVSKFNLHITSQFTQSQLPSHVERNWHTCTLSAFGICMLGLVYAKYGDDIMKYISYFYEDHVKGPVERNIEYFSGVAKPNQFDITATQESLKISEESAATRPFPKGKEDDLYLALASAAEDITGGSSTNMYEKFNEKSKLIDDILRSIIPTINKIGPAIDDLMPIIETTTNIFQGPFTDFVHKNRYFRLISVNPNDWVRLLSIGNDAYVEKVYDIMNKKNHPVSHKYQPIVLPDSLQKSVESIPSEFKNPTVPVRQYDQNLSQKSKDDIILANPLKNPIDFVAAERREVLRKIIEVENQANKVLQDMHMLLGLTALIPVITLMYSSMFASKNIYNSVAYKPICTFIRHLEVLLNGSFYQQKSFEREGHLYFLTEQLKLTIGVLTVAEQKLIRSDIEDLQSEHLDYVQKFNVIQRMYRTYKFLAPTAI